MTNDTDGDEYEERKLQEAAVRRSRWMSLLGAERIEMSIHPCSDACRLEELEAEIERLQTRLAAMRQCFIDNTLRTTPSAKGTNIGKQIDEAVDRVVKQMSMTPNASLSGLPLGKD